MKRTYRPSKLVRKRNCGFRVRKLRSPHVLRNRRAKGRKRLCA